MFNSYFDITRGYVWQPPKIDIKLRNLEICRNRSPKISPSWWHTFLSASAIGNCYAHWLTCIPVRLWYVNIYIYIYIQYIFIIYIYINTVYIYYIYIYTVYIYYIYIYIYICVSRRRSLNVYISLYVFKTSQSLTVWFKRSWNMLHFIMDNDHFHDDFTWVESLQG